MNQDNTQVAKVIRLHEEVDGDLKDMKIEFELHELADTVPAIGDFIVEPGVIVGKERNVPANRTIYEVISRYFMPGAHGDDFCYVAVVVKKRCATEQEFSIACVS